MSAPAVFCRTQLGRSTVCLTLTAQSHCFWPSGRGACSGCEPPQKVRVWPVPAQLHNHQEHRKFPVVWARLRKISGLIPWSLRE